jgi:Gram-negative bacterial TonB protein C-terminal
MTDLFLERRVRDLVAGAQEQAASQEYEAALGAYRTALRAVEDALSLDPSNQTATLLRPGLIEAMGQLPHAPSGAALPHTRPEDRAVEPPSFALLKEGDVPLFENAENLAGPARGGYLPEEEVLSILDAKPRPEKPDYLPALAAILSIALLVMAARVIWYYSTARVDLGVSPLERQGQQTASTPPPVTATPNAGPEDDTLYFAPPEVTLPVLRSKFEPQANSSGKVSLLVVIDPTGKPTEPRIWQGLDPDLNVLAMKAAGQWRFQPGTRNGKPVPVIAQLEVNFRQP